MTSPIVLVGEAWGEDEVGQRHPFVGMSGVELYRMLCDAGYDLEPIRKRFVAPSSMKKLWAKSQVTLLNVFNSRPPDPENRNRIQFMFGSKTDKVSEVYGSYKGTYPLEDFAPDINLLHETLRELRPNIIITLGNTAMWALLGLAKISVERGSIHDSPFGKVLPTFHPAAILRKWEDRPLVIADLIKARTESESPDFKRVSRKLWVEPNLADLETFWNLHLAKSALISIDIETERNQQISEIGFAADEFTAIHIPFMKVTKRGTKFVSCKSYWDSPQDELAAWDFVHKVCASPVPKVLQNGLYDIFWLWEKMRIPVLNASQDTMLLHHALYPELAKGLGFLGATYMNELSWKKFRHESNKPDE